MSTLEQAIALAVEKHRGQQDKYGHPYILHPLRVMFRLNSDTERIVGILHDVVEDCNVTLDDLRAMGFSEKIVTAIDHVTRRDDETYEQFVNRSQQNPLARTVKLADLEDNMDVRRLQTELTQRDFERLQRYRRAWEKLSVNQSDF
jgi:(p)ppGpp synthase/HD superfamily hydrolase